MNCQVKMVLLRNVKHHQYSIIAEIAVASPKYDKHRNNYQRKGKFILVKRFVKSSKNDLKIIKIFDKSTLYKIVIWNKRKITLFVLNSRNY